MPYLLLYASNMYFILHIRKHASIRCICYMHYIPQTCITYADMLHIVLQLNTQRNKLRHVVLE